LIDDMYMAIEESVAFSGSIGVELDIYSEGPSIVSTCTEH